tara:strand:+ start:1750 stop:2592 length:843 start_codon:yes stop_codon:yes gene_type:complete
MHVLVLTILSRNDNIEELKQRTYMLDRTQEIELIKQAQKGSDAAKTQLYMAYERFIRSVAKKYANNQITVDDLFQHATIGFLEAIQNYNIKYGARVSISSYSRNYMLSQIFHAINTMQRDFKLFTTKAQKKAFCHIAKYRDGNFYLSAKQRALMATELNINESDIIELEKRLITPRVSINGEFDDEGMQFGDMISDGKQSPEESVISDAYYEHRVAPLVDAVESLPDREKEIIKSRFLNGDDKKVTFKELAKKFGVKPQRIEQIQKQAMMGMRAQLSQFQ